MRRLTSKRLKVFSLIILHRTLKMTGSSTDRNERPRVFRWLRQNPWMQHAGTCPLGSCRGCSPVSRASTLFTRSALGQHTSHVHVCYTSTRWQTASSPKVEGAQPRMTSIQTHHKLHLQFHSTLDSFVSSSTLLKVLPHSIPRRLDDSGVLNRTGYTDALVKLAVYCVVQQFSEHPP